MVVRTSQPQVEAIATRHAEAGLTAISNKQYASRAKPAQPLTREWNGA